MQSRKPVIQEKLEDLEVLTESHGSLYQEEERSCRKDEEYTERLKCMHWKADEPSKAKVKTASVKKRAQLRHCSSFCFYSIKNTITNSCHSNTEWIFFFHEVHHSCAMGITLNLSAKHFIFKWMPRYLHKGQERKPPCLISVTFCNGYSKRTTTQIKLILP